MRWGHEKAGRILTVAAAFVGVAVPGVPACFSLRPPAAAPAEPLPLPAAVSALTCTSMHPGSDISHWTEKDPGVADTTFIPAYSASSGEVSTTSAAFTQLSSPATTFQVPGKDCRK